MLSVYTYIKYMWITTVQAADSCNIPSMLAALQLTPYCQERQPLHQDSLQLFELNASNQLHSCSCCSRCKTNTNKTVLTPLTDSFTTAGPLTVHVH